MDRPAVMEVILLGEKTCLGLPYSLVGPGVN